MKDFTNISKHMRELNKELNSSRMTDDTRRKIRITRLGTGNHKAYTKTYGRHTHRVVAEKMLGRHLEKGEVVHHIDRNKWNNHPINLMIFRSQAEHAAWHKMHDGKEGDVK